MAEKSDMNKILNWKLGQIKQLSNKLKEIVDSYVSKITGLAQVWIDRSEDYNPQGCLEVSTQLDQAMLILTEKITEIESKLASKLLVADTLETKLKPATHLSSQITVGSMAIDQPLSSLQERIHSLESVVGSVQAGVDQCRKKIGSVEGIKANLENLASQVEVISNDKSVQQIQREIEHYKSKEVDRMQSFEDQLSKIENTLSTTDCQLKDLSVSLTAEHRTLCDNSSKFDHRLSDLEKKSGKIDDKVMMMEKKLSGMKEENKQVKLQIDGGISDSKIDGNVVREIQDKLTALEAKISNITENNLQSLDARLQLKEEDKKAQAKAENTEVGEGNQAIAANEKETQPRSKFTGFIASGTSLFMQSEDIIVMNFDIVAKSTDTLLNKSTGMFTAPVDGTYMVIFVQKQLGINLTASTLKLINSNEINKKETHVFTASTVKQNSHSVAKSRVSMSAGDRLYLCFSKVHNVQIPVFCCVLIE